jgi:hypothetical protein
VGADELEALTRRVVAAVRERDLALLDAVLAPGFTLTTGRPGAEVRTREAWLAITAGRYEVDEERLEELEVAPLGADGAFRVSDAWARGAGGWRLAARHSTAVPAAGGERLRVRPERLVLERTAGPAAPLRAEVARDEERTTLRPDAAGDWAALEVEGPLDLALTGVMARLSGVLAAAGVPLFAVSTYDTDVLLVRAAHLDRAVDALAAAGHAVAG